MSTQYIFLFIIPLVLIGGSIAQADAALSIYSVLPVKQIGTPTICILEEYHPDAQFTNATITAINNWNDKVPLGLNINYTIIPTFNHMNILLQDIEEECTSFAKNSNRDLEYTSLDYVYAQSILTHNSGDQLQVLQFYNADTYSFKSVVNIMMHEIGHGIYSLGHMQTMSCNSLMFPYYEADDDLEITKADVNAAIDVNGLSFNGDQLKRVSIYTGDCN